MLRLVIIAGLFLALPLLLLWWLSSPPPDQDAPGMRPRVALTRPVRAALGAQLKSQTQAEKERIGQLQFIFDPFIMPPPREASSAAPALDADAAAEREFRNFAFAYERSGCARGHADDRQRLGAARQALQNMDLRLRGLAEARLRYHQGLVALCEADFPAALTRFRAAAEAAKNGSDRDFARQYRSMAALGAWLVNRKVSPSDRTPLGKIDTDAFFGRLCTQAQSSDCDLFDTRSSYVARAALSGLLLGHSPDRATYVWVKNELGSDVQALGPETVSNLAAAAAIFDDPDYIATLMQGADRLLTSPDAAVADAWRSKPAAARLVNLAWITGRLEGNSSVVSQGFPGTVDLPVTVGFVSDEAGQLNSDIQQMAIFKELVEDRALLTSGAFEEFVARANAPAGGTADDQKFLAEARGQMLQGTSDELAGFADRLRDAPAGEADRTTLLRLLRTSPFSYMTRLNAAAEEKFGLSFETAAAIFLIVDLILLALSLMVASILAGYARAFPRRHSVDRARNRTSGASAASGAAA